MSTTLSALDKSGFRDVSSDVYTKIANAIKRVWNDSDGKNENSKYKLLKSSGKGFYDGSAEAIYVEKKTNKHFLVRITTNYGRSWKSPDNVRVIGVK